MKTNFNTRSLKPASLLFSAIILVSTAFTSCTKDKANTSLSAYVQVANSAEGSAPQDFYLDNSKVTTSAVAYGQSSTFIESSAGDRMGAFKNTGSATTNTSVNLSLSAGKYYTVFYVDGNTHTTVQDDRTAPPSGKARIRFINLSSALSSNVDFALSGGAKLASAIGFKGVSEYYDVDPASSFSVSASGSSSALVNIPTTIQAGHIYTIFVSGDTNATVSYHLVTES